MEGEISAQPRRRWATIRTDRRPFAVAAGSAPDSGCLGQHFLQRPAWHRGGGGGPAEAQQELRVHVECEFLAEATVDLRHLDALTERADSKARAGCGEQNPLETLSGPQPAGPV